MITGEGTPSGPPEPKEQAETTAEILRKAFKSMKEFGLDVTVTNRGDHTEVKGPDEEPPVPPTQPSPPAA